MQFVRLSDSLGLSDRIHDIVVLDEVSNVVSQYTPLSVIPSWIGATASNETARQVLELIGGDKPLDFRALFNVYELIQSAVGNIAKTLDFNQALLGRFTRTTNSPKTIGVGEARHGYIPNDQMAPRPLPFSDAQALIFRIVARWLDEENRAHPQQNHGNRAH